MQTTLEVRASLPVFFPPETFFEELGAVPYFVKDSRVVSGKSLETEIEWIRFPRTDRTAEDIRGRARRGRQPRNLPTVCRKGCPLFGVQVQPFR